MRRHLSLARLVVPPPSHSHTLADLCLQRRTGARFNVCTGDIEDAPGIGNLYTFSVTEQDGKVFIEGEESKIKAFSRAPSGKCTAREDGGVVVVGGGSGGHHFLEEIRNAGYKGKVTLVAREAYLPLDRCVFLSREQSLALMPRLAGPSSPRL